MKSKKLSLSSLIIISAFALMLLYALLSGIAKKPAITQMDFPFSISYELNGEIVTIQDVYTARFTGNGGYVDLAERRYEGFIQSDPESGGSSYILREGEDGSISLHANFHPDYMLGDNKYDYYVSYPFEPHLSYYDPELGDFEDEQTLLKKGVRLISWEYPEPVENSFVFSHIVLLCGMDVLPLLGIGLLALLAVLIFVKKQGTAKTGPDRVGIVCNFALVLLFLPFATIVATFSDIMGSSEALDRQLLYIVPAITALGVAASISLRRKGKSLAALLAQFVGPLIFCLCLLMDLL